MTTNNPDKSKGGRPLFAGKDYDTVLRKLETAWALDCSDAEAARFASISSAALSDFLKRHPDIAERKLQLKDQPILSARSTLLKAINRGNADLALKYLERKRKDEFTTKQEIKHSGGMAISEPSMEAAIRDPEAQRLVKELLKRIPTVNPDNAKYAGDT